MKVTIAVQDSLVIVDGNVMKVEFIANGEWAIQYNGITAEVEYTDYRQNEILSSEQFFKRYQRILDDYDSAIIIANAIAEAAAEAAEAARIAAKKATAEKGV
jgi:hypothetical protein